MALRVIRALHVIAAPKDMQLKALNVRFYSVLPDDWGEELARLSLFYAVCGTKVERRTASAKSPRDP